MIVGTQKGGTTALHSFLLGHPDICVSSAKEPHFFDLDFFFEGEAPRLGLYLLHYQHFAGQKAIGEATPTYMYAPQVARRLYAYNPMLKLVFLLRNPVERAYSHYTMERASGVETLGFGEALRVEDARLHAAGGDLRPGSPFWVHSYRRRGYYMRQIENLLRYFPREQMLFLRSESLLARHDDTLSSVYRFLGVGSEHRPAPARVFAGEYRQPLLAADRETLLRAFDRETDELERFLGWDLGDWRR